MCGGLELLTVSAGGRDGDLCARESSFVNREAVLAPRSTISGSRGLICWLFWEETGQELRVKGISVLVKKRIFHVVVRISLGFYYLC